MREWACWDGKNRLMQLVPFMWTGDLMEMYKVGRLLRSTPAQRLTLPSSDIQMLSTLFAIGIQLLPDALCSVSCHNVCIAISSSVDKALLTT